MFFTKKKSIKERYAEVRNLLKQHSISLEKLYTHFAQTPTIIEDNFADSICGEYRKAQKFAAHAKGEELYRQVGVVTGFNITVGLFNMFIDTFLDNLIYLSCEHRDNSLELADGYDLGYEYGYCDGLNKCIDLLSEYGFDVVGLDNGKEE